MGSGEAALEGGLDGGEDATAAIWKEEKKFSEDDGEGNKMIQNWGVEGKQERNVEEGLGSDLDGNLLRLSAGHHNVLKS